MLKHRVQGVKKIKTLVLGIGNTLLSDEGAGIHALNLLQSYHPDASNLVYIDGGTLNFTLAAYAVWFSPLIASIWAINAW